MILHADDGLLASTREARERLLQTMGTRVEVKVSEPLLAVGDEVEFPKRRYILTEEGVIMMSGTKHLEGLLNALGHDIKERDSPADATFLEPDNSAELNPEKKQMYQESVGRLLYLSHTRADLQFSVSVLASKMAKPTVTSWRWLTRVTGYLKRLPEVGFLIRPLRPGANLEHKGEGSLADGATVCLEGVTDSDWGGCKRSRRSRSSAHFYLGGSLMASHVRVQKSISLSLGRSRVCGHGGWCSGDDFSQRLPKFSSPRKGLHRGNRPERLGRSPRHGTKAWNRACETLGLRPAD